MSMLRHVRVKEDRGVDGAIGDEVYIFSNILGCF